MKFAFIAALFLSADPDGVVYLKPEAAQISGAPLKVERKGKLPTNLGYWVDASNTVTWNVDLREGGKFTPSIVFSCSDDSAGSVVAVISNDKELTRFTVPGTGKFTDFRVLDLAPVELPAGKSSLKLQPISKPGQAVMDIRLITLTPEEAPVQ